MTEKPPAGIVPPEEKRKPGRPPGKGVTGRPRGRPPGSGATAPASLQGQIKAALTMVNVGLILALPKATDPATGSVIRDARGIPVVPDALTDREIDMLATALYQQCTVSPAFRKYLEAALGIGKGANLLVALGMIAAPRLIRHGLVPGVDPAMGSLLQADGLGALFSGPRKPTVVAGDDPAPVESPTAEG